MRKTFMLAVVTAGALAANGCVLLAAGGAGAVAYDEAVVEKDGKFDPLEKAYDGDPDTKPLEKDK